MENGGQSITPQRTLSGRVPSSTTPPIVIWINSNTASALELVTAALHDNCRAIVMGEKSFGKGVIQSVYGLQNGAALIMTDGKYLTPSGKDINKVGIKPDIQGGYYSPWIPFLASDTSYVNFQNDIPKLLKACQVPIT